MTNADDVLRPSPSLLCKIGSIVVHIDELLSPHGHDFDRIALNDLMKDKEVSEWMKGMRALALLPEKRNA